MTAPLAGNLICRTCLGKDSATSSVIVQHLCTNEVTGKQFDAFVCARCLEEGQETRVTCRTFMRAELSQR